jgi:hypothetical protein
MGAGIDTDELLAVGGDHEVELAGEFEPERREDFPRNDFLMRLLKKVAPVAGFAAKEAVNE